MIRHLRKSLKVVHQLLWYFFLFTFIADTINVDDFFPGDSFSQVDETIILIVADSRFDGGPATDCNAHNNAPQTLQKTSKQQIFDLDSKAVSTKHTNYLAVNAYFREEKTNLLYAPEQISALYIDFCSLLI